MICYFNSRPNFSIYFVSVKCFCFVVARTKKTATFSGSDYLHYNFTTRGEAIVSDRESIKLSFKTSSGDGLLFYTG